MNRKQFLKDCACGLCTCAVAGVLSPTSATAAETKPPEDGRLRFVKTRYAKLIEILAGRLDAAGLSEVLRQLGYSCASGNSLVERHKGDVDGYIREFKTLTHEDILYDREKGIITVVGMERSECVCPLIDKKLTPSKACDCTLGWQQHTFETLLGKKVRAELKESVLRGDKRCVCEVHVLDQPLQQGGENPDTRNEKEGSK
jgi:hypothetical protein